jgi:hypothetical protein
MSKNQNNVNVSSNDLKNLRLKFNEFFVGGPIDVGQCRLQFEDLIAGHLQHQLQSTEDFNWGGYVNQYFFNHMGQKYSQCFQWYWKQIPDDFVQKLLEDLTLCIFLFKQSDPNRSHFQRLMAPIIVFFKLRYPHCWTKHLRDTVQPYAEKLFSLNEEDYESTEPEVQSFEERLDQCQNAFDLFENFGKTPIVRKLWKLTCFCLTFNIFDSMGVTWDSVGYSAIEKSDMIRKYSSKKDFALNLVKTALFLVKKGYQVYKTGDPNTIFHAEDVYQQIYDEMHVLKRWSLLLHNPREHGFTESEFRGRLDALIEKMESIYKHSIHLNNLERKTIASNLQSMKIIRDDVNTRKAARTMRRAPFGLLIFGDSGIGKSGICKEIASYYASLQKLPKGDDIYIRVIQKKSILITLLVLFTLSF